MKRSSRGLCAALLSAWISLGAAGIVSAADEIVVPRDAGTIAEALSLASEGTTILIDPPGGVHQESVVIDVDDVTIRGRKSTTVLESPDEQPALLLRADGIIVRDLTVRSDGDGVRVEGSECTLERVTVFGATVGVRLDGAIRCSLMKVDVSGAEVGFDVERSRWTELRHFAVSSASTAGLRLGDSSDSIIIDGEVIDCGTGLLIEEEAVGNLLQRITIETISKHGVHVSASSENQIEAVEIIGGQSGMLFEASTVNAVLDCTIRETEIGIHLLQCAQNRLQGNTITGCVEAGISLEQSSGNSISHNAVGDCGSDGLRVEGGTRNLLMANTVERCRVGISLRHTDDGRVLRNVLEECSEIGLFLDESSSHQVLDNVVSNTPTGIKLDRAAETVLLRNRIFGSAVDSQQGDEGDRGWAIHIHRGSNGSWIGASDIAESDVGIAVAGGGELDIVDNSIRDCATGLIISGSEGEIHVEGNLITANGIGLRITPDLPPLLANNTFSENVELDILNQGDVPVHAAANWWDLDGAGVAGPVLPGSSAWQGTIAIGTTQGQAYDVLGRILQLTLEGHAYRVIDLVGIGDEDQLNGALAAGDVDVVWWSPSQGDLGDLVAEETQVFPSGVREGWVAVASDAFVSDLPEATLSVAFPSTQTGSARVRLAAPSDLGSEMYARLLASYAFGPSQATITWVRDTAEAETMLKLGGADLAIVNGLEETLTRGAYTVLRDDKNVLGASAIAIVARVDALAAFPELLDRLENLAKGLTSSVLHDLTNRVRLLGVRPEDAARGYLESIAQDAD